MDDTRCLERVLELPHALKELEGNRHKVAIPKRYFARVTSMEFQLVQC